MLVKTGGLQLSESLRIRSGKHLASVFEFANERNMFFFATEQQSGEQSRRTKHRGTSNAPTNSTAELFYVLFGRNGYSCQLRESYRFTQPAVFLGKQ